MLRCAARCGKPTSEEEAAGQGQAGGQKAVPQSIKARSVDDRAHSSTAQSVCLARCPRQVQRQVQRQVESNRPSVDLGPWQRPDGASTEH